MPLLLALTWATQYGWTSTRVESLLALSAVMLVAFLYVESKAAEPMIPLVLFRDPIISICSVCAFVLGMGMFGVIIYLPLFMQGVLGVSATQSGNLLTPLMMGAVVGSIVGGQTVSRTGRYKGVAIVGSALVAIGHGRCSRGWTSTRARLYVVYGMIDRRTRHGPAAAGLHARGAERRAATADGRGDVVDDLLSIDRQHGRRRRVRLDHADALSRDIRAGDAGARAAGGAAVFLEPADAGADAAADRSRVQPMPGRARRCCRRCSRTCDRRSTAACT